jgi:hypothetical protein
MNDSTQPKKSSNKKSNNNKKRNFKKNNRRPKSLSPSKIAQKYDNLLEQHVQARAKYFHLYGRSKKSQIEKALSLLEKTRRELHSYEKTLKDWQLEILHKKLNVYPEDRKYSTTHELSPIGEQVEFVGDFEDPHLLQTQEEASYKNDTEESAGTMDDYAAYKESR